MKIIFFASRFYPQIGGVEKHSLEVAKRLISLGHEITVITEDYKPHSNFDFKITHFQKIKVYSFNFGKKGYLKKFRIWLMLLKHKWIFYEADIIHFHDVFIWYLPFRFLCFNKKVFTTFHGYESYPIRWQAKLIRKISEKLSAGNICIGEFISKWYGTKPTYISYGGIDTKKISNVKCQMLNVKSALFIGRLDEQTGILEYSEAIEFVRKKYPNFKFVISGDGKYKKNVKHIGNVLGFVKNPESLFSEYNIAFVSRYLAILEALVAKHFVIAVYDNPVKEDYLRMTPFAKYISIVNSSKGIADAVFDYYNNLSLHKTKIEAGYKWAKKQSWNEVVKIYLRLWNNNM